MHMNELRPDQHVGEKLSQNALQEMPIFNGFSDIDMQKLLGLMQDPVRAIDTCMGKEQLRKVAKQLLAQNLALQTTVRNLQIENRNNSQAFEEAYEQLDAAVGKHTEFDDIEDLMMREAAQQEVAEAQGQLDLETSEAAHADAVTAQLGHGTFQAGPVDTDGYANDIQAAAGGMTQKPMEY